MAQRLHLGSVRLRQDNERKECCPDSVRRDLERCRRMILTDQPAEQRAMLEATIAHLERLQEAA